MTISKWVIVRTIMMALVALNLILKAFGIHVININESTVYSVVEALIEIGAIAASWWYNNSFTEKARMADEFFRTLKEEK